MSQSDVRKTKFCVNCGAEIDAKAEICPKCGVRVARAPPFFHISPIDRHSATAFLSGIEITF